MPQFRVVLDNYNNPAIEIDGHYILMLWGSDTGRLVAVPSPVIPVVNYGKVQDALERGRKVWVDYGIAAKLNRRALPAQRSKKSEAPARKSGATPSGGKVVHCRSCDDTGHCKRHATSKVHCGRCAGTGLFVTGMENGKPVMTGGSCFRCNGKGHHVAADCKRNSYYDTHRVIRL